MALVGTLNDFSLVDIIQLVDLGKKTGILMIHGRRGNAALEGRIYFQEGTIHSAEFDDLAGDEAAFTLFMATEGSFEFVQASELPPRNIQKQGKRFQDFPLVLQYNKRDLPAAVPVAVLDKHLNQFNWQRFEAVAMQGQGVFESLQAITRLVLTKL